MRREQKPALINELKTNDEHGSMLATFLHIILRIWVLQSNKFKQIACSAHTKISATLHLFKF